MNPGGRLLLAEMVLPDGDAPHPAAGSKHSELDRFRVLFQHCGLPTTDISIVEAKLHSLLALPMYVRHFPWASANTPPTILGVIYLKHTVASEQARGMGRKLHQAAITNNYHHSTCPRWST
jgi:hypothetical protein